MVVNSFQFLPIQVLQRLGNLALFCLATLKYCSSIIDKTIMASIDIQLEKTYTISVVLPELAFVQYRRQKAMKNYIKMDKRQVGVRIWELIDSSAMTIEQISEFLCLSSPRVIYDWMSGKKIPTIERAYNVARLFDTTVEDIFFA